MICGLIVIFGGIFCSWCAYNDYDWFMNNYKARLFVRLFGRDGARKFYIGLGIFLILAGIVLAFTG
jgi:hypothetical protein